MKKKLLVILALVLAFAMITSVLCACDDQPNGQSGLTDAQLKSLVGEVYRYHKDDAKITNEDFGLIGSVSITDENNKELSAKVAWTADSSKISIATAVGATGFFKVTMPDRATLEADLEYTLTATLVNAEGVAYKDAEGKTYSVSFSRTVERKTSNEADAKLTFNNSGLATPVGEKITSPKYSDDEGYASIIWEDNGIKVVNNMAESVNTCKANVNPARFYKDSTLEISYTSAFKAIRLTLDDSSSGKYLVGFDNMSVEGATIVRAESVVLISFAEPVEKFISTGLSAQTRIFTVEIFTDRIPELDTTEAQTLEVTIEQALAAGEALDEGASSKDYYKVTGVLADITNTTYGNSILADATTPSTTIVIFGMYDSTGKVRYDAMGDQAPKVGDTLTLIGKIKKFSDSKSGAVTIELVDARVDGLVISGGEEGDSAATIDFLGGNAHMTISKKETHTINNYVNKEPVPTEKEDCAVQKSATFNGITVINDIADSTSEIVAQTENADKLYLGSTLTVKFAGMTGIKITCDDYQNNKYATGMDDMEIEGAKIVRNGNVILVAFDAPVSTFTTKPLTAQLRINKIDVFTTENPFGDIGGGDEPTPDYEPKQPAIIVTPEKLGLTSAYADGANKVVGSSTFSYNQLYFNDSGIQMRDKTSEGKEISALWNTVAFENKIEAIVIRIVGEKLTKDMSNALRIDFGTDNTFAAKSVTLDLVAGQEVYTVVADGDYTFVRIVHSAGKPTVYVASVSIHYEGALEGEEPHANTATEAEILAALATLEANATLPDGPYVLQGKIKSVDTVYSSTYKNITVTIEVGADKVAIQCFRMKGGEGLKVGDEIKVTGELTNYVKDENSILQFATGAVYELVAAGETGGETGTETIVEATIAEILAACADLADGSTTETIYKVTGILGEVTNKTYGNATLIDATDKTIILTVYGMYDADGTNRYDAMGDKAPKAGDTVTLVGAIKNFKGTIEIVNAKVVSVVPGEGGGEEGGENGGEEPEPTPEGLFTFSEQGYENAEALTEVKIGDDVTITFNKGSNSNAPAYYTSGTALRIYGGNSMTVSAAEGKKIKSITIVFGSSDGTNEITVDVGTLAEGIWTGDAASVTFTIGGTKGNRRIAAILVEVE